MSAGCAHLLRAICTTAVCIAMLPGCEPADGKPSSNGAHNTPAVAKVVEQLRGSRPNIVLITICSCCYGHLGIGGYDRNTTPFIDSLAASGMQFAYTVSSSSWTKPTTASIITGLSPNVHGLTDYYEYSEIVRAGFTPKRILSDQVLTIAECLAESGYATICRNNNVHAGDFFNMTQGCGDFVRQGQVTQAPAMLSQFESWLGQQDPGNPFFCFILTKDLHVPYLPKYEYYQRFCRSKTPLPRANFRRHCGNFRSLLERQIREDIPPTSEQKQTWSDLYDAQVAQLDAALSKLPDILRRAGRLDDTVIVITGDHGERFFGAHGATGHAGEFMGEALIHVPLVFAGKGIPKGVRVDSLVRSIDIYPTLAALAGAKVPDVVQGRSLLPRMAGDVSEPPTSAFASYRGTAHAIRWGKYSYHQLSDGSTELYDIKNDPGELTDLFDKLPDVAERIEAELDTWLEQERRLRELVDSGQTRELSPEVIEELRSLGYVD